MPDISLPLSFSDLALQRIDDLRGSIPRDEFLRRALQLGLCDLQDEATRQTKEGIYQAVLFQTSNFSGTRISMGKK